MTAAHGLWLAPAPLVLASGSATRRAMLAAAGIPLEVVPATVDERAVEERLRRSGADAAAVAQTLAREKALAVSRLLPGRVVLGADQTLDLESVPLHKPADLAGARTQLRRLSGRTHVLWSAAALLRDGDTLQEVLDGARMTMRPLSDGMIERYCAVAGPAVLGSVGGYQLEAVGIHLFAAIEGDHFTILGLPLLKLLAALRREGLVPD